MSRGTQPLCATNEVSGLEPSTWVCVGRGYAREEIKEDLLRRGARLVRQSVGSADSLASLVLETARGRVCRLATTVHCGEFIKQVLSRQEMISRLPFFAGLYQESGLRSGLEKRVERALGTARTFAAHEQEAQAMLSCLSGPTQPNHHLRKEVQLLAEAYQIWLSTQDLWDGPALLKGASEILESKGWPRALQKPHRVLRAGLADLDSGLERRFFEALGLHVRVDLDIPVYVDPIKWTWLRAHSMDEAAEAIDATERDLIVIPDAPQVRRSLQRVLGQRLTTLIETRDPTELRTEEEYKLALLPFEVVASGYDLFRIEDLANKLEIQCAPWIQAQHRKGELRCRNVPNELKSVIEPFQNSQSLLNWRTVHLQFVNRHLPPRVVSAWLGIWDSLVDAASEGIWGPGDIWQRLKSYISEASPPPEPLKPTRGVAMVRLSQCAWGAHPERVFLFCPPQDWLSSAQSSDDFLGRSERDALSMEFGVVSNRKLAESRLEILRRNLSGVREVVLIEASFDPLGKELGSASSWLRTFNGFPDQPLKSPNRTPRNPEVSRNEHKLVKLAHLGRTEVRASELEAQSRCGFQGLAGGRWKLEDLKRASRDPWPESRGTFLHDAVRRFEASGMRDPTMALEQAWEKNPPQGVIESPRLTQLLRRRFLQILKTFAEQETTYRERVKFKKILEAESDEPLRLNFESAVGAVSVYGRADRVDLVEGPSEGLSVIDYKTSSNVPPGKRTLENGYRLQLPFYALAASEKYGLPIQQASFVELTRTGGRSRGFFFSGVRKNSLSLMTEPPEAVWPKLRKEIKACAESYVKGEHLVKPRIEGECDRCRFIELCQIGQYSGNLLN